MNELLVLLLPLAAFSGWWLARADKKTDDHQKEDDYFKGLSYLLEDETDKAIDIFFRIAHLDDSTIENQITLGNLFRHRGEIDRALHIHSNLLNSGELAAETRQKLNLALADDYLAAGIMNHAEEQFQLVCTSSHGEMRETAKRKLIRLYADQKKWHKAIEVAEALDPFKRGSIQQQVAHFHCELGDAALSNDESSAQAQYQKALACDKHCVRATVALARIAQKNRHTVTAIDYFKQVEQQNPAFLPEILDDVGQCYQRLNQPHEWREVLERLVSLHPNPVLVLRLNRLIAETEGIESARVFLQKQLQKKPNMLILQAYLACVDVNEDGDIHLINRSIQKILSFALKYRCCECGFRGNRLNWCCPGCKNWGTFTPISDINVKETIVS